MLGLRSTFGGLTPHSYKGFSPRLPNTQANLPIVQIQKQMQKEGNDMYNRGEGRADVGFREGFWGGGRYCYTPLTGDGSTKVPWVLKIQCGSTQYIRLWPRFVGSQEACICICAPIQTFVHSIGVDRPQRFVQIIFPRYRTFPPCVCSSNDK